MYDNIEKKQRGKQKITYTKTIAALLSPSPLLCVCCSNYLRCMYGYRIQKCHAARDRRPCYRKQGIISFYYDKIHCMTFDKINYRVTDHSMYGKSTEISLYIRKCLNKISKQFPYIRLTKENINNMIQAFRKYRPKKEGDELWLTIL